MRQCRQQATDCALSLETHLGQGTIARDTTVSSAMLSNIEATSYTWPSQFK